MTYAIHIGSNLDVLPTLHDNSIDSIVTDPPYELAFMGKSWDSTGIAYNVTLWKECLRVLKPGGHLLAFSGSRTYHRMTCAIEDAGFEVRDQMMWVYGSGFPKSHNVSKAINKAEGVEYKTKPAEGCGFMKADGANGYNPTINQMIQVGESSSEAKKWDGWGTALKPAHEPICLARKPLNGTVVDNVRKWGVGGLNIDGCRVGEGTGRFPANLMHDGSQEVLNLFPDAGGGYGKRGHSKNPTSFGFKKSTMEICGYGDSGSAARFFYCPKASKSDRGENNVHPTVKPTELMIYLCRLVTPPGGTVLDPFMGSGSTGRGAVSQGFKFIGIELSKEYAKIAEARIKASL